MATTVSLFVSIDPQQQTHKFFHCSSSFPKSNLTAFLTPKHTLPFPLSPKSERRGLPICLSTSHSSSNSPSASPDPLRTGRFLSNQELEKLQFLENFRYLQELESGFLWIRMMREEEMDMTVALLAESFAESMLLPAGYVKFLAFLVKQYLIERRTLMPHTATLLGFYRRHEESEEDIQLAGTVEVCFDKRGANASPPTPTPPKNSPYICNMSVKKPLRRRGIGWQLLKACEELICQMSSLREVYLHCRMIDAAPLNMYKKAGYSIVSTDNIFVLLTLQRRKHLMCKQLLTPNSLLETSIPDSGMEFPL